VGRVVALHTFEIAPVGQLDVHFVDVALFPVELFHIIRDGTRLLLQIRSHAFFLHGADHRACGGRILIRIAFFGAPIQFWTGSRVIDPVLQNQSTLIKRFKKRFDVKEHSGKRGLSAAKS
jgi:hypothetical protein